MAELSVTTPGRTRLRRLRRTPVLRNLVAETHVTAEQLIMPQFVLPERRGSMPVESMPGIAQLGVETLVEQVGADLKLGIRAVLLFGHPEHGGKTPDGRAAAAANGAVQQAVERLKREFGDDLVVMTDVCLCAYTDHGHCGVIDHGEVVNDASLAPLVAAALSHARAGADVVAPSDMMDGRAAAIRDALDASGCSCRMRSSSHRRITGRFAKLRTRRRRAATAVATKWTSATRAKLCAKRCSTWRKAPTGSW